MYPYQRTPMGNPYIYIYKPYIVGIYGLQSPKIPRLNTINTVRVHVRERGPTPFLVPWSLSCTYTGLTWVTTLRMGQWLDRAPIALLHLDVCCDP